MRKLFILTILLIAFVAGLYTQRMEVLEWYREVTEPELPEAVAYAEVVDEQIVDTSSSTLGSLRPEQATDDVKEETFNDELIDSSSTDEPGQDDTNVEKLVEESLEEPVQEESIEEALVDESVDEEPALPTSINLAVPFSSQAPQGSWDEPYQEACEEASVYMVHAYFSGMDEGQIPADTADKAIVQIVEFEMELFGAYKDTTAEKTGVFAELLYGHTYQVLNNPTVEDIQRKLVQGFPVIVPAAGRLLRNPYFTAPGPLYHMLVIRGYTQDGKFIVNDPGTYRGEAYLYDFDTIMNAMHDWNDGGEITEGGKVVLVLSP